MNNIKQLREQLHIAQMSNMVSDAVKIIEEIKLASIANASTRQQPIPTTPIQDK